MKLSERVSWYFYDWANSAFSTTVATVFLGPYITELAKQHAVSGLIDIFGFQVAAGSFFPYVVSLSVFLQVFLLPIIGALADYSNRKKQLLLTFAYIGALATMGLYFVTAENFLLGGLLFILAG
jgi:UMF1 family MFS transporter